MPKFLDFLSSKSPVDRSKPIEMSQEAFDSFWSKSDQEEFRMRHYEAAFSLWLVIPIAFARLFLSNYSKQNGLVEIDDIDIYGEHIPSFMAKYALICLSTFGIKSQADFMCEPFYHSSTGFALITLEDFFFFIILLSILPSWNPKQQKHIESCQQVLNNFDN